MQYAAAQPTQHSPIPDHISYLPNRALHERLSRPRSAQTRYTEQEIGEDAVAISSIPQHAVANGIGQSEDLRAQFTTFLSWVVRNMSGSCWVSNIAA